MQIIDMPIGQIKPYEHNPRNNDAAVEPVAASIREFGFRQPIVVDAKNIIICGHTRYRAAKRLGLETVPVLVASDLSPEKVKAYRLADNKTAEATEWLPDELAAELGDLQGALDMAQFGFDLDAADIPDFDIDDSQSSEPNASDMCTCPKCGFTWRKD
nr:MAG TPA: ParB protein [Caudoviricetes sp.]